jgi:hypothetical protein
MQRFRSLGLIETNENRSLVIKKGKLTDYLARNAIAGRSPSQLPPEERFHIRSILNRN